MFRGGFRLKERIVICLSVVAVLFTLMLVMDIQMDLGISKKHLAPSHGKIKFVAKEEDGPESAYNSFKKRILQKTHSGLSTNISKESLPNETAALNNVASKSSNKKEGILEDNAKEEQLDDFSDIMDYIALDSFEKEKFRIDVARIHPVITTDDKIRKKHKNPSIGDLKKIPVEEAIWDKKCKSHHNSVLLTKLWKEVAIECNTTVTLAKSQWKRLRETFKKKLTEMPVKHSGDGAEDDDGEKPDWQYFNLLLFLKDQCVPRNSTGNFETSNSEAFEETEGTEEESALNSMDEVVSEIESQPTSPTTPASSSSTPQHRTSVAPILKKAKRQKTAKTTDAVGEALLQAEHEKLAYLKRKEENRGKREGKELDEDEAFFKSILPHVRAMNPKQKMRFRIQVLQFVDNEIPTQSPMQSVPERFPFTHYIDSSQSCSVTPGSQPRDISANQQGPQVFPQQIPFQSGSNVELGMAINQGGSSENEHVDQSLSGAQHYHLTDIQTYRNM